MKHTPTPWLVNVWTTGRRTIETDNRLVIAEIHQTHKDKERTANAEFIVRACNCHDELLEACQYLVDAFATVAQGSLEQKGISRALQILAKIKGTR